MIRHRPQVWNPLDIFLPLLEGAFRHQMQMRLPENASTSKFSQGEMQLAPFTSRINQALAREIEQQALEYLSLNNPLCSQRWRSSGELLTTGMDKNAETSCLDPSDILLPTSFLLLENVHYYDNFVDGAQLCRGGGRYFAYNGDTLQVDCLPCPINTFRDPKVPTHDHCLPCPPNTFAPSPGSFKCNEQTTNKALLVVVITTALVAVATTMIVVGTVVRKLRRNRRDNQNAPKRPHVEPGIAMMFTDIQASTTMWAHAPEEMARAVEAHHALVRYVIHQHGGYEVKTIGGLC